MDRRTTQAVRTASLSDEELITRRRAWFEFYSRQRNVFAQKTDVKYTCPCCGHRTLDERGAYEICPECGWEDDGQDDHDSAVVRGGPNGRQSLDAARAAYVARGGIHQPHTPPSAPQITLTASHADEALQDQPIWLLCSPMSCNRVPVSGRSVIE